MRIDVRAWLRLPLPTLTLGLLNVVILAGIIAVLAKGTQTAKLLATQAKPPPSLAIDLASSPATPDLAAIQSRPLMHSTRSFYAPPAEARPTAPPLPDYRLAGSFIGPSKRSVALLADRSGGGTRRVHQGDDVGGWQVQSIEARRVVLKWQEQIREITAADKPTLNAGLRRVPMQRQRVAAAPGKTVSLGATSLGRSESNPGANYPPAARTPRFYRPPPN